jgi:hypothetical protein
MYDWRLDFSGIKLETPEFIIRTFNSGFIIFTLICARLIFWVYLELKKNLYKQQSQQQQSQQI